MSKPRTIENTIPEIIRYYIKEAKNISNAYGISVEAALNLIVLIELLKIHTHIDKMSSVLQLIEREHP